MQWRRRPRRVINRNVASPPPPLYPRRARACVLSHRHLLYAVPTNGDVHVVFIRVWTSEFTPGRTTHTQAVYTYIIFMGTRILCSIHYTTVYSYVFRENRKKNNHLFFSSVVSMHDEETVWDYIASSSWLASPLGAAGGHVTLYCDDVVVPQ